MNGEVCGTKTIEKFWVNVRKRGKIAFFSGTDFSVSSHREYVKMRISIQY